ncbi:sulfotransferase 1C4-like [Oratosquilla oratoria]|uniref:sulfotransferase 1C4-like n=1 Tax=Oratosquilla oratoria TaxID=337810 RepID=UPI003F76FF19
MIRQLKSGHTVKLMEEEELANYRKVFPGTKPSMVRVEPGDWLLPNRNLHILDSIYDFEYRPSDVVIITYSKCGTTWTQEVVWTMKKNPGLDHPEALNHMFVRSPFIEADILELKGAEDEGNPFIQELLKRRPDGNPKKDVLFQLAEVNPDPRIIKTHLPFSLMPSDLLDKCKVIYVARNPLDACVSYHHHCRLITTLAYAGTMDQFVDSYMTGDLLYGPYLPHVKEAWEKKGHKNLHFLFFEDMKKDPKGEIKKLDAFLGTGLSDDTISKIVEYTSFSAMKERNIMADGEWTRSEISQKDGGFLRKGVIGDWKNKLSPEQAAKLRTWADAELEGTGIQFAYSTE